ncbi:ABC transporter permease, partial [bacterium]
MIKNYIKIAWRNLWKHKVFSAINILGLTIGITVCMMIFLYILNEFSVDNFHTKGKNIYRVMRSYDALKAKVPYVSPPYATALQNDFPSEIKQVVRVMVSENLITFGNKAFNEKKVYKADAGFFTMFSFPLLKGNPATVLQNPGSIVLTETMAKKYFGSQDPMGKVVEYGKQTQLKVTGIAK